MVRCTAADIRRREEAVDRTAALPATAAAGAGTQGTDRAEARTARAGTARRTHAVLLAEAALRTVSK